MREIKFRVWNRNGQYMIKESRFDNYEITLDGQLHFYQNCEDGEFGLDYATEENGYFIMQYTGLKDINGKEIYEGDIVKITSFGIPSNYKQKQSMIDEVIFENGGYTVNGRAGSYLLESPGNVEILGNVYENPELLNE